MSSEPNELTNSLFTNNATETTTTTKRGVHRDETAINQQEEYHSITGLTTQIKGAQQKLTFSLLAELTVMLPQFENELGSKQLHLGVWRKHFRWCSLLNHCICLNIQVPIYSMAEADVIRMAGSLANYQIL